MYKKKDMNPYTRSRKQITETKKHMSPKNITIRTPKILIVEIDSF
jgi:hypothetical protein